MDKKKVMYIGIILLVTVITSITYFSYAFFTKKDEYHGRLNIVAGELKYRIESADLENNSITIPANTNKKITVEIESLNSINSEYKLVYDNSNVEVGYKSDTEDMPSGSISNSGKKKVTIVIKNVTNTSQTVTFGVKGGFSGKEVVLNDEHSIDNPASTCSYADGYVWNFNYTGNVQSFTVPCDGYYKLETWGAQGGSRSSFVGGGGGYSVGDYASINGSILYVYVGGAGGSINAATGGYNGGGGGGNSLGGAGGGATDIRTSTNINDQIIVAGGGGGANNRGGGYGDGNGGAGGGYVGQTGSSVNHTNGYGYGFGTGGTQTAGGKSYWSGGGGTATGYYTTISGQAVGGTRGQGGYGLSGQSGGGGGYYGGGGSGHGGAGGGSGYIGSSDLINKHMTCYNCEISNDTSTKTISNTCVSETATSDCSKTGNGYARITYLGD